MSKIVIYMQDKPLAHGKMAFVSGAHPGLKHIIEGAWNHRMYEDLFCYLISTPDYY